MHSDIVAVASRVRIIVDFILNSFLKVDPSIWPVKLIGVKMMIVFLKIADKK